MHNMDKANVQDLFELNMMQKGMLFHHLESEQGNLYNVQLCFAIDGPLDPATFIKAFHLVQSRNEVLRAVFNWEVVSKPVQVILKEDPLEITVHDLSRHTKKEIHDRTNEYLENDRCARFDLTTRCIRISLLKVAAQNYLLVLTHHHILYDGWSTGILLQEWLHHYNRLSKLEQPLMPAKPLYRSIQQALQQQHDPAKEAAYWTQYLNGYEIKPVFEHPQRGANEKESIQRLSFPLADSNRFDAFSAQYKVTKAAIVYAAYGILMQQCRDADDIVIGTTVSGRHGAIPGIEQVMGNFINTIPLRINSSAHDTLLDIVTRVNHDLAQQNEFPQTAYYSIKKLLGLQPADHLFDSIVVIENYPLNEALLKSNHELHISLKADYEYTHLPLVVTAVIRESVEMVLTWNPQFLSKEQTITLGNYLCATIDGLLNHPLLPVSAFSFLSAQEQQQLLAGNNQTTAHYSGNDTIVSLIEKQALAHPLHTAIIYGDETLTFQSLNNKANALARELLQQQPHSRFVPVFMNKSLELPVTILAILKCGKAFVSIDINWPLDRTKTVVEETDSGVLLVNTFGGEITANDPLLNELSYIVHHENLVEEPRNTGIVIDPDAPIFVIYTSGTTGKPKGAINHHKGILNRFLYMNKRYGILENDVILLTSNTAFDAAVWQLFWPLTNGRPTVIPKMNEDFDIHHIVQLIDTHKVTITDFVPSVFNVLVEYILQQDAATQKQLASVRQLLIGGEAMSAKPIYAFKKIYPGVSITNTYGPCETSIGTVFCEVPSAYTDPIPIGRPIDNVMCLVLDRHRKLTPPGRTGELYLGGVCVGYGYVNDKERTRKSFVQLPWFENKVFYKTGDLVHYLPDGNLVYIGRRDNQVKINGVRVELLEIERKLNGYKNINDAVVTAPDINDRKYLVAYYVSKEAYEVNDLRQYLGQQLPPYMVPSYYFRLESWPLTANGKLDKRALPQPALAPEQEYIAPVTPEEKLLAGIWSEVLGVKAGTTDNYFALGGDSINSIRISSRIKSAGYKLSIREIFKHPTIKELALQLQAAIAVADQSVVTGTASLSPIQQYFFDGPLVNKHHYNQSMLLYFPEGLTEEITTTLFGKLIEHHDALRMVFREEGGEIVQVNRNTGVPLELKAFDLCNEENAQQAFLSAARALQSGLDWRQGPLMRLGLFQYRNGSRLLIVIHHLVIDGVSWRILLEDLDSLYQQFRQRQPLVLPAKTDAFLHWPQQLKKYINSNEYTKSYTYWKQIANRERSSLPQDSPVATARIQAMAVHAFQLEEALTTTLLTTIHTAFNTRINDILLAGLLWAIKKQFGLPQVSVDLEGHGREMILDTTDVSRTVGWFTSIYPVWLESESNDPEAMIIAVKETLRSIPDNGIGYLMMRKEGQWPTSPISFNYLGQFHEEKQERSFTVLQEERGEELSPEENWYYTWDFLAQVRHGRLEIQIRYSREQYGEATIVQLMEAFREGLLKMIRCCTGQPVAIKTPADLTYKQLTIEQLKQLQRVYDLEDIYPLSPMQEGMLFHSLAETDPTRYFEQKALYLEGELDRAAIEKSIDDLTDRYEILRTVFLNGIAHRPLQVVLKKRKNAFEYKDLREECRGTDPATVIDDHLLRDRSERFDLAGKPLLRTTLLHTAPGKYVFIWSNHHVLMDGWCLGIIWNDFKECYAANRNGTAIRWPPAKKYLHYIEWLEKRDKKMAVDFWKQYLQGLETIVHLPGKENSIPTGTPGQTVTERIWLGESLTSALQTTARQCGVTLNTLFQTAWSILLAKYNGAGDIAFGAVVSGRPPDIEQVESMVGLFINTIPVRVRINAGDTVSTVLQQVQQNTLLCEPHQYIQLSDIQSASPLGRSFPHHLVAFENYPLLREVQQIATGHEMQHGFRVTNVRVFDHTHYELVLIIVPGIAIELRIDFKARSYDAKMMRQVLDHFRFVLEQMAADAAIKISDIKLMEPEEQNALLHSLDNSDVAYPEAATIVSLFKEQVSKHGNKEVIRCGNEHISYAALDERSDQLAVLLQEYGVKKGDIVGLLMDRSIETVIGMLGILKAGGAYLPIDVDYPAARIDFMMEDSGVRLVVSTASCKGSREYAVPVVCMEDAWNIRDVSNFVESATATDLCYVIYTSGTTGTPKGVMIEHRNVVRLFFNDKPLFDFGSSDVWTMFHSHCFDFSVWEIYGALLFGGRLIVIPKLVAMDTHAFLQIIKEEGVTILNQTPTAFYNLIQEDLSGEPQPTSLRYVVFGGEALSPGKLQAWHDRYPEVKLINMFGITETTVHVTYKEIGEEEIKHNISNVGKPIPTLSVYILDELQQPVPKGVTGELYVGGAGVSRGYLGRPELTAQRFVQHVSKPHEKMYRSGDLARILSTGEIEYIGRADQQVQLRGFRIELGEIESQLRQHDRIREAVVIARTEGDHQYLIGYYVSHQSIETGELRQFLSARLPDYMVPAYFVPLQTLPLTSNGKLDKEALPSPNITKATTRPHNETQKELVKIWAALLHLEEDAIDVHTSFFELGGDSLTLVKMTDAINRQFNAGLTVARTFAYPIIASLANFLDGEHPVATNPSGDENELTQMQETIGLLNQVQQ